MNTTRILKKLNATLGEYEEDLGHYSEEEFLKKLTPATWSAGQAYEHIISNTLDFHIRQIEACLTHPNVRQGRKKWTAHLCFLLGFIPKIKIHLPPEELREPGQPADKESTRHRLASLRRLLGELAAKIEATKSGKRYHLGFGHLTAVEWFALVEMHFHYHLKEKRRLDRQLSV